MYHRYAKQFSSPEDYHDLKDAFMEGFPQSRSLVDTLHQDDVESTLQDILNSDDLNKVRATLQDQVAVAANEEWLKLLAAREGGEDLV